MRQVFEGIKNKNGKRIIGNQLTKEEKKRRVVLKRVNLDGSVLRSNFLKAGTMAKVRTSPFACFSPAPLARNHVGRCRFVALKLQVLTTQGVHVIT